MQLDLNSPSSLSCCSAVRLELPFIDLYASEYKHAISSLHGSRSSIGQKRKKDDAHQLGTKDDLFILVFMMPSTVISAARLPG